MSQPSTRISAFRQFLRRNLRSVGLVCKHILYFSFWTLALLSMMAPYVNPYKYWPPAFLGLFFIGFWFASLLYIAIILTRHKARRLLIVPLCLALLGLHTFMSFISWDWHKNDGTKQYANGGELKAIDLSVLTFNVKGFGMLDTKPGNRDSLLSILKENDADVVLLQEFCKRQGMYEDLMDKMEGLGYKYHAENYVHKVNEATTKVGQAVFSKYPFSNITPITLQTATSNGIFYVEMRIPNSGDTVRIYNCHLQSLTLSDRYFDPTKESTGSVYAKVDELNSGLRKFNHAFRKRSTQLELLVKSYKECPHLYIVAGDFNESPTGYLYRKMNGELTDAWREVNWGIGATYDRIPLQRIDYIWLSDGLKVFDCTLIKNKGATDHKGVLVELWRD